jgi:DNA-directed RNA polymerase omega subunit
MNYFSRGDLLVNSNDSIYKLVILASERAIEIAEGQPKMVEASLTTKPSTIALAEIAQGKVQCKRPKTKE